MTYNLKFIFLYFPGWSMYRSTRIPDISQLWRWYWIWIYLPYDGEAVCWLWKEIKAGVCGIPGSSGTSLLHNSILLLVIWWFPLYQLKDDTNESFFICRKTHFLTFSTATSYCLYQVMKVRYLDLNSLPWRDVLNTI